MFKIAQLWTLNSSFELTASLSKTFILCHSLCYSLGWQVVTVWQMFISKRRLNYVLAHLMKSLRAYNVKCSNTLFWDNVNFLYFLLILGFYLASWNAKALLNTYMDLDNDIGNQVRRNNLNPDSVLARLARTGKCLQDWHVQAQCQNQRVLVRPQAMHLWRQ